MKILIDWVEKHMKIEVWSDFACPYCYLGEKKLEKAIAEVELKSPVEITFRSFQLNVDAGSYDGQDINTLISKNMELLWMKRKRQMIILLVLQQR